VGVGKSALVEMLGHLAGGYIDLARGEDAEAFKKRLLSPGARGLRLVRLDNVKGALSGEDLEALVTSPAVSGHRLYHGEARRPNLVTLAVTTNGAELSPDMASRCVQVRLARPAFAADWASSTHAYIEENRQGIIADIRALLERPAGPLDPDAPPSRWADWEAGVLARVKNPAACQRLIRERGRAVLDDEMSAVVRERFAARLRGLGHDPKACCVFLPSLRAAEWLDAPTRKRWPTNKASGYLGTLKIHELSKTKKDGKPGWRWLGAKARSGATMVALD
jgi:hypothetical protein